MKMGSLVSSTVGLLTLRSVRTSTIVLQSLLLTSCSMAVEFHDDFDVFNSSFL